MITEDRESSKQIEILKGESIRKYHVGKGLFFEFKADNITGRTTDKRKLGFVGKVLMRKTGRSIIAAYDDTDRFPEQSLYFTYGESSESSFYILAILNSSLMDFIYFHTALTNRDSIAQIKKVDLDALPFVKSGSTPLSEGLVKKIGGYGKEIHDSLGRLHNSKTEHERTALRRSVLALEKKIDDSVYELYGMSKEHQAAVDAWKGKTSLL